jgi:hypothetical protein
MKNSKSLLGATREELAAARELVEEQRKKAKTAGTKLERKNAKRTAKLIDDG